MFHLFTGAHTLCPSAFFPSPAGERGKQIRRNGHFLLKNLINTVTFGTEKKAVNDRKWIKTK